MLPHQKRNRTSFLKKTSKKAGFDLARYVKTSLVKNRLQRSYRPTCLMPEDIKVFT